jgi:cytochrome c peroxidase
MTKLLLLIYISITNSFAGEASISFGERLFNDVGFSQAKTTSCISCHQVDAGFDEITGVGMRSYSDFTAQTNIPFRTEDNNTVTLRNTPSLLGIGSRHATSRFSHWDGEFHDHSETVLGNFTGRNMGWLKGEKEEALRNIVKIIKEDDGTSELAQEFGGSYKKLFLGVDPSIPEELRLDKNDRLNITTASDKKILSKVTQLVTAYMDDLNFEVDEKGEFIGSPYDQFLIANKLPRSPRQGESLESYQEKLRTKMSKIKKPVFVKEREFATHGNKTIAFDESAWKGMNIFFGESGRNREVSCSSCHQAPLFTNQRFHNVGVSQTTYDKKNGMGSFMNLSIPRTNTRTLSDVDLGVWNFYGKKGKAPLTAYVNSFVCIGSCTAEDVLKETVGRFKTPGLRNLGHSAPYFHDGSAKTLDEVLVHYTRSVMLAHHGRLRNGDSVIKKMMPMSQEERVSLKAFLSGLNENYE